jgi:hypothetical protein
MEKFHCGRLEESFARFERAAAKGHEESIWIVSVVKGVKMEKDFLKEAFAMTVEPLGWYFAGRLSVGREGFDFFKKSAEGGCSWGQVEYAVYFLSGEFVENNLEVFLEWLEKAFNQNNPKAMNWLGYWFRSDRRYDKEKAVPYYLAAAEMGWKTSMRWLSRMLRDGEGCEKDLRQAVIWSAKGDSWNFWVQLLEDGRGALESGAMEDLDCDFNQLCYSLGWGLYWYQYEKEACNTRSKINRFVEQCLGFYCSCVELQQRSIFTFLLCWNRTTGVKGPGQMIAHMVWKEREDNMVKTFEDPRRRSARLKRIKN